MDFEILKCKIEYDGPALVEHVIDVNQLAPALLAFSEAMTKISKHVNPDQNAICNVKVKAFSQGSFISDLIIEAIQNPELTMGIAGTIISGLPSDGALSHVDLLFKIFVDVVKAKLFQKTNEGRNLCIIFNIGNTVTYNIEGNGNSIATGNSKLTIMKQAHELLEEGKIDAQMRDIVAPLAPEKIEKLTVSTIEETPVGFEVQEKEREYFFGEQETKTMYVKVKGEIENMHKKFRTFGLVEGKSKIPCFIPKEESIDKYADLFSSNLVEIEGEAEINAEDNTIVKIKVTGGRKLQMDIFSNGKNEKRTKKTK